MNIIKVQKNKIIKGCILLFLAVMLIFPGAAFRGAASGLLLWFHNVLPTLLPFIIISNLLIRLNISAQISRVFYPVLGRVLRISREGCYPVIFGFLSGIPMGAKAASDLVVQDKLSVKEGRFLAGMCNNASPMFILGYLSITQLKLPQIKYALFVIIYCSTILGALLYRFLTATKDIPQKAPAIPSVWPVNKPGSGRFSFDLLDGSIMNGFEISTRIGGYIILFSIAAQILKEIGPDTGLLKAFVIGILEITTGVSQICATAVDIRIKIVLAAVITAFGGLSGVAQTKSVLQDTRLSIHSYVIIKLFSAAFASVMAYLYVKVFLLR